MSHPEQVGFFEAIFAANTAYFDGASILEVGSYDVNGTVRKIFATAGRYVGVDLIDGPGVDVVEFGHKLDHADDSYDASISGECFEHDPHWPETFSNRVRMTRPGGLVAFSCASRGRPEHGTSRTDRALSPGTQAAGLDYYRNLIATDFEQALGLKSMFEDYRFWYLRTHFDLYFAGIKAGQNEGRPSPRLPDDETINKLESLMPVMHKVVRAPLRILSKMLPEPRYQSFILPYWNTLARLAPEQQRQSH